MKYCTRCGTALQENAGFCTNCGAPVNESAQQAPNHPYQLALGLMEKLCGRLRVSAIMLLITGILQIFGCLSLVAVGISTIFIAAPWIGDMINEYGEYIGYYTSDFEYYYLSQFGSGVAAAFSVIFFVIAAFTVVVCVVNFVTAKRTFRYIKQIQQSPVGIVHHFQSAGKPIAVLVLNIISGGAVGIIGAAFGLAARSVVTGNWQYFSEMERQVR